MVRGYGFGRRQAAVNTRDLTRDPSPLRPLGYESMARRRDAVGISQMHWSEAVSAPSCLAPFGPISTVSLRFVHKSVHKSSDEPDRIIGVRNAHVSRVVARPDLPRVWRVDLADKRDACGATGVGRQPRAAFTKVDELAFKATRRRATSVSAPAVINLRTTCPECAASWSP